MFSHRSAVNDAPLAAPITLAAGLMLSLAASALPGQTLHVNSKWDECAIVFDPALTQHAFHQFVGELALVVYFRPMSSAKPLGRRHFEFAILDSGTRIDDADAAWNDTFSHPDSMHWLFEGDALKIPGLMLRMGVTDRVDVGAYYTKSIGANYSFVGGQIQYNLLNDVKQHLAAAGRVNVVRVFGPQDVSASVFGVDFLVSKDVSVFSPYAGISGYLSRAQETTSKVNLADESVFGVQGMVGVAARISVVRLGAEFNMAKVPGYSVKIGFGS